MFKYLIDYRSKKNNKALLEMINSQINELELALENIEDMRSIDKAYGASLDLYGDRLNVKRGNYNDETYRLVLKGHMLALRSRGTLDDIARIIAALLNIELDEISIEELYEDFQDKAFAFSEELEINSDVGFSDINGKTGGMLETVKSDRKSATIEITRLPLSKLLELGITTEDFLSIIKKAVAAGVALNRVDLSGTFEFGNTLETDSELGFDNGTLGAVFGKESI